MTDEEFRTFLDAISVCFVKKDFSTWRARIILPLSLITQSGIVTLSTEEELEENFRNYLAASAILNIDQVFRRPISLTNCNDGTWIGTYETELLSRGTRAIKPYTSSALLVPRPAGIRMMSILNARGHHEWTRKMPGAK